VLDVGQGLAAVVRTRHHVLVYDPGPLYSAESDAGQRVVVPYLRALGVDRVDVLMITHRDSDHAGGAASVRAALPVGRILASTGEPGAERCAAGQAWTWDGVAFAVLHPDDTDYGSERKANNLSCVLRVEAGGRRMLLTSDIEARDEALLLARAAGELAADVLLVPHHGSRTSSTPEFLAAVDAREAVIPVGYRNRFGHPKAEVVARHAAAGSRIWRTDRDGAVSIRLGSDGATAEAWRQVRRRYWQDADGGVALPPH
jgi:competence protein ComEC